MIWNDLGARRRIQGSPNRESTCADHPGSSHRCCGVLSRHSARTSRTSVQGRGRTQGKRRDRMQGIRTHFRTGRLPTSDKQENKRERRMQNILGDTDGVPGE